MAYLPFDYLAVEDTMFPKALSRDVLTGVRMIDERARRTWPRLRYWSMSRATAPRPSDFPASEKYLPDPVSPFPPPASPSPNLNVIDLYPEVSGLLGVVEAPVTQFDPLWGESVDPRAQTTGWQQPHANPDRDAEIQKIEKHIGPFPLHGRIQREPKEKELKRVGFDQVREMLVYIPVTQLDQHGIVALPGDYFLWDDTYFSVTQTETTGYWKNTNLRLYVVLNCEHRRAGS